MPTHQVVDAQQQRLDAAVDLALPTGCEPQVNPHQLGQELQSETPQAGIWVPVQFEQLVAHWFQKLDKKINK